jgi:hypothetical protein
VPSYGFRSLILLALAGYAGAATPLAQAAPGIGPAAGASIVAQAPTDGLVSTVQFRFGYRPFIRPFYRPFYGPVIRPYYYAPYYVPYYAAPPPAGYYGGAVARCAAQFRSFNPRTGTYTTYGGEVRLCPYLQ